jgi:type IV secretion system protein VirB10
MEQEDSKQEAIRLHNQPPRTRRLNKRNLTIAAIAIGLTVAAALYGSLLATGTQSDNGPKSQVVVNTSLGTLSGLGPHKVTQPPPPPAALRPAAITPPPAPVMLHSPIFAQAAGNGEAQPAPRDIKLPAPGTGVLNPRDADNRQDEKLAFAAEQRMPPSPRVSLPVPLATRYTLKSGTVIPAVLVTGMNSDLPGMVIGQVSQPVFDTVSGQYLLIPQGSKVISEYNSTISYGQTRVQLAAVSLHLPNGSTVNIGSMPIVDQSGYTGLSGDVDNHWDRVAAAIGATGALAYAGSWATKALPDAGATAAAIALSNNTNQIGSQIVAKQLQIQPTITLPPGSRFNILLSRDLIIPPYDGQ